MWGHARIIAAPWWEVAGGGGSRAGHTVKRDTPEHGQEVGQGREEGACILRCSFHGMRVFMPSAWGWGAECSVCVSKGRIWVHLGAATRKVQVGAQLP